MTFYRPDLHSELKRLCFLQTSEFKTPKLLLGSEVVSAVSVQRFYMEGKITEVNLQDIDTATVTLANGSTLSGDLLIGADGERVSSSFPSIANLPLKTKTNI
jgi:hypothetical protein